MFVVKLLARSGKVMSLADLPIKWIQWFTCISIFNSFDGVPVNIYMSEN